MRATQLALGVINRQTVLVENLRRQRVFAARLKPTFVRIMHERGMGDVLAPELIVIEEVAVKALDKLAQRGG